MKLYEKYLITEAYGEKPMPFEKEELKLLDRALKGKFKGKKHSAHEYIATNKVDGDEVEVLIRKMYKKIGRWAKVTIWLKVVIEDGEGNLTSGWDDGSGAVVNADEDTTDAIKEKISGALDSLQKKGYAGKHWKDRDRNSKYMKDLKKSALK